jgi:hypothetical protein
MMPDEAPTSALRMYLAMDDLHDSAYYQQDDMDETAA